MKGMCLVINWFVVTLDCCIRGSLPLWPTSFQWLECQIIFIFSARSDDHLFGERVPGKNFPL